MPVQPGFSLLLLYVPNNYITLTLKGELTLSEIKCTSFLTVVGKPRASRSAMICEKKKIIYRLR